MTGPSDVRPLPCGTHPDRLLTYAAEQTVPASRSHEATCPYCQTAISEYRHLWEPVRQWATRDIAVPRHLVTTIMTRVRRIVQSPRHAATVSERGVTTVTSWVLGLIASGATLDTANVAGIGRTPDYANRAAPERYGADGVEITEIDAADINVALSITARGPTNLPQLADTVRHNIIEAIAQRTHINTGEVDITIDDIDLDGS